MSIICVGHYAVLLRSVDQSSVRSSTKFSCHEADHCVSARCRYHEHSSHSINSSNLMHNEAALSLLAAFHVEPDIIRLGVALQSSLFNLQNLRDALFRINLKGIPLKELAIVVCLLQKSDSQDARALALRLILVVLESEMTNEVTPNQLCLFTNFLADSINTDAFWLHFPNESDYLWRIAHRTVSVKPLAAMLLLRSMSDPYQSLAYQVIHQVFPDLRIHHFSPQVRLCLFPSKDLCRIPPTCVDGISTCKTIVLCAHREDGCLYSESNTSNDLGLELQAKMLDISTLPVDVRLHKSDAEVFRAVACAYVQGVHEYPIMMEQSLCVAVDITAIRKLLLFLNLPCSCNSLLAHYIELWLNHLTLDINTTVLMCYNLFELKHTIPFLPIRSVHHRDEIMHFVESQPQLYSYEFTQAMIRAIFDKMHTLTCMVTRNIEEVVGFQLPIFYNLPQQSCVAGGAAYYMANGSRDIAPSSDVDIFVFADTQDVFAERNAHAAVQLISEALIDYGYSAGRKGSSVLTFVHPIGRQIQIVRISAASIEEVLLGFDFFNLQVAWTPECELVATRMAIRSFETNFGQSPFPVTPKRIAKIMNKGIEVSDLHRTHVMNNLSDETRTLLMCGDWHPAHVCDPISGTLWAVDAFHFRRLHGVQTLNREQTAATELKCMHHRYGRSFPIVDTYSANLYVVEPRNTGHVLKIHRNFGKMLFFLPRIRILKVDCNDMLLFCCFDYDGNKSSLRLVNTIKYRLLMIALLLSATCPMIRADENLELDPVFVMVVDQQHSIMLKEGLPWPLEESSFRFRNVMDGSDVIKVCQCSASVESLYFERNRVQFRWKLMTLGCVEHLP